MSTLDIIFLCLIIPMLAAFAICIGTWLAAQAGMPFTIRHELTDTRINLQIPDIRVHQCSSVVSNKPEDKDA